MKPVTVIAGTKINGLLVTLTGPACGHCRRQDCGLLADAIRGLRSYVNAVAECYRASGGQSLVGGASGWQRVR